MDWMRQLQQQQPRVQQMLSQRPQQMRLHRPRRQGICKLRHIHQQHLSQQPLDLFFFNCDCGNQKAANAAAAEVPSKAAAAAFKDATDAANSASAAIASASTAAAAMNGYDVATAATAAQNAANARQGICDLRHTICYGVQKFIQHLCIEFGTLCSGTCCAENRVCMLLPLERTSARQKARACCLKIGAMRVLGPFCEAQAGTIAAFEPIRHCRC